MKSLFAYLIASIALLFGCVERPLPEEQGRASNTKTAEGTIPPQLVGEWRDTDDETEYAALYLLSDGRGAFIGVGAGTALGAEILAEYDPSERILTLTMLLTPEEGGRQMLDLSHDPDRETLSFIEQVFAIGPLTRHSNRVPEHVLEELK